LQTVRRVLNPGIFAPNPDGRPTGFTLFIEQNIRENAVNNTEVDFIAVHGATDAPTVDVQLNGTSTILVDNAAYSDITPYLSVPAAAYTLDVTPGNNNSAIVATYLADLSGLAGGSAIIFASGFLDPSANQNGAAFGLWATLSDGTTFPLSVVTGNNELNDLVKPSIHPNPVYSNQPLYISNNSNEDMVIEILSVNGSLVNSFKVNSQNTNFTFDTSEMAKGIYIVKAVSESSITSEKLIIQ
jgi:hypothetical protein